MTLPDGAALRIGFPDEPVARALLAHWAEAPGAAVVGVPLVLEEAERVLRAGLVDLAFLPSLAVLRDPEAFLAVPGVALVGQAHAAPRLHLRDGIEALRPGATLRVGLDPRHAQEAFLVQVLLRELYQVNAQFVPVPDGIARPDLEAALVPADAADPASGLSLALGREWFELTTRPMVWALLVGMGGPEPEEARFLSDGARTLFEEPDALGTEEPTAVTLGAYAFAGLEAWAGHLYYHRAIADVPEIAFVPLQDSEGAPEGDDEME